MSGSQQLLLGGSVQQAVDPYFYSVTSLLHGDGTNGGQNNTFLDSSSNNFTITRNGNTTQGSFSPFSQTGWSNYFDGTGDYLTVADSATLEPSSSDFTIECWVYPTATGSYLGVFSKRATNGTYSPVQVLINNGTMELGVSTSGSSWAIATSASASPPLNQWSHIAVVRNGTASNNVTLYLNGTSVVTGSVSSTALLDNSAAWAIGADAAAGTGPFAGYISNFRYVKGTAVYTGAFTPPTTPLTAITNTQLLTCQSNRFRDASTNNFAITRFGDTSVQPFSPFNPTTPYSTGSVGGSGYFDGSGDYLTATSNAAYAFGTGDFTIEAWVYSTNYSGTNAIFDTRTAGNEATGVIFYIRADGKIEMYRSAAVVTASTALSQNSWNHVALTRSGSTCTLWLNGTSVGTATDSTNLTQQNSFIGAAYTGVNNLMVGYISSLRVVKGTAVYTATFTPPTAPLTAITNTSLLTNFTNGAIFDNAAVADYETVGNAQISTSVKKYGTGSMSFDGTGDYLVTAAKPTMTLGTGDFTVEFWMYANTPQPSTRTPLLSFGNGFTTNVWDIQLNNTSPSITNQINVWAYNLNSAAVWLQGGPTIAASTWYHIAVCRNGSTFKLFVNGTQAATATSTSSIDGNSTTLQWQVAYNSPDYFNGYIDDIRITKGVARYNYNFTPPTAEFPNIGGTVTLTADPYFDYTTLLLPGNGTNGAQNNTFLDSSTNAFTITRNGNTTQGTFSPFSQTGWGNYFNGTSGEFLNTVANTAFNFGTGDFTVEAWVYPTGTLSVPMPIIEIRTTGGATGFAFVRTASAQTLNVYTNSAFVGASTISLVLNSWNHVALTRSGNTWSYWINGTSAGSFTNSSTQSDGGTTGPKIGGSTSVGEVWIGYISNARITKGGALYTSNFTPSTTPLTTTVSAGTVSLLTCQSNRFLDSSSNAFAITINGSPSVQAFSPFNPTAAWSAATNGGSGYFDGSGDYLTTTTSSALDLSTGDWTIQGWYYPTAYAAGNNVLAYVGASAGDKIVIADISTGGSGLWYLLNGSAAITSSTKAPLNAWSFFALVKSGSTTTLYLNGVSLGTTTSVPTSSNKSLNLGSDAGAAPYQGYMADFRILKGTANTTVPTAPLTAITNTSLLLNFTNAGITDATAKNDLETVGNAQISTTQSKFGGSSMYFDGTGDWLVLPPNPPNNLTPLGTGDFTVEFWVRFSSFYNYISVVSSIRGANGFNCGSQAAAQIVWYANGAERVRGTTTLSANTWYHIAFVRYSGTLKGYVNGVQEGTTYADSINYSTPIIRVGDLNTGGEAFTGYLQDLRITKGIARYTANFTAPTTAFPLL